jgi:hypothetical protein
MSKQHHSNTRRPGKHSDAKRIAKLEFMRSNRIAGQYFNGDALFGTYTRK